ncbi:glutathione S-transferase T3-like isoform X2 [Brassica napus]|uniref:glutathione S-transferase T3-like isoform X2 n=2 Tax=Brassica TaxID=3705 RepID=UPI000872ECD1|nr:glutathione S-transferase T3-like isoform X2 [Brassica napus]
MDYNPSNFVDLLNSQQDVPFGLGEDSVHVSSSQVPHLGETPAERKERRTWTPTDDQVLISAWLNTSKDPIVGNEQRSGAFWQRIAAYFAASPKIGASERRESSHCKQHWHKINDQVGKFCGAFEAASRERTSGQNDNDVLKHAHEIFFNNHNKKFTLEHAWKEIRNDQKWCDLSSSKMESACKRRKLDNSAQSAASHASESMTDRPPGVKSAKANGKKGKAEERLSEYTGMWSIRQEDMANKKELTKMKLLDRLIAKVEPLDESEEILKKKLIKELFN